MAGSIMYYCPVLGKKVEIKAESEPKTIQSFDASQRHGICFNETGVCRGNCLGCSIMLG